ncbi:MAG TPA: biotin/lipoyl-containing protein, partial [Anaerolineales bacterium]|nr:biotin/lipoyl-containing protein [Anaerolineales bacterium]
MATKVLVPLLGEGVEEVTIIKWLKREGDSVDELEPLLEVNTDKVDTEIPAPASGTVLKIVAEEGAAAKVGEVLAFIGKPGESVESSSTAGAATKTKSRVEPQTPAPSQPETFDARPSTKQEVGFISPVVAKIAAEHGVNLQEVQGTGMNGRITKNDVLSFIESGRSTAPQPVQAAVPAATPLTGDQLIKHTVIRKQIAEHMVMSKHTSPHVLTVMEADMSRVVK